VPLQNVSLSGAETVLAVRTAVDAGQDVTSVALLRFDLGIDPARCGPVQYTSAKNVYELFFATDQQFGPCQLVVKIEWEGHFICNSSFAMSAALMLQDPLGDALADGGGVGPWSEYLHHPGHQRLAVSSRYMVASF
jgi:hypothetical protein